MSDAPSDPIFAVDIGATNVKFGVVSPSGRVLSSQRRPTPYPCTPQVLVDLVARRARRSGCRRVGVGFPGEFVDGRCVGWGNLARRGGAGTPVDPAIEALWRGFALEAALREETGLDVRVVNDATLAAIGSMVGEGREVVITLGTGCGLALTVDGVPTKVRDVGAARRADGRTYDETVGELARETDEGRWRADVVAVVDELAAEFTADRVHLAGGNARRVDAGWFAPSPPVDVGSNEVSLRGAARLFESATGPGR